jgi:hypothetical protein
LRLAAVAATSDEMQVLSPIITNQPLSHLDRLSTRVKFGCDGSTV